MSEPEKEAQGEECEEVGVAYVSLLDILHKNKDVIDEDIVSKFSLFTIFENILKMFDCLLPCYIWKCFWRSQLAFFNCLYKFFFFNSKIDLILKS